ncbi:hypothetical protein [Marinobacterium aestuariivivens]|uniref:2Fe-2S ferredoxin-type domain-containing protein n=1 Tax=Marinobacterium aestuariivivens TaxID=1698799 RepID=A0ABW1ZW00_9GAMM
MARWRWCRTACSTCLRGDPDLLHQTEDPYRDRAAGRVRPAPLSIVSSRGGYCGCCKVRLIDGEVEMVQDSLLDLPEGRS